MNKKLTCSLLAVFVLCAFQCFAHGDSSEVEIRKSVINNGVGLGAVIAVVASWSRNKSILWAILHGLLSWLYVIYFAITKSSDR